MRSPAGESVVLIGGGYEAEVVEVGAGLRSLRREGHEVIAGYGKDQMCSAGRGQLLIPWPNRIRDGRYEFGGERQQLALNEVPPGNAIHGLTRWASWVLLEHTRSTARYAYTLHHQPGYPFSLDLEVRYSVGERGLSVHVSATNHSDKPAPYGHGAHPYLTVGRRVDDCELLLPAGEWSEVDDRGIPEGFRPVGATPYDFRSRRRIGELSLDHPYTALAPGADGVTTVELRDPESGQSARLWAGSAYRCLQVFTGDGLGTRARQALAVEPMTCPPDAFHSGIDVVVLAPGESHTGRFGIA